MAKRVHDSIVRPGEHRRRRKGRLAWRGEAPHAPPPPAAPVRPQKRRQRTKARKLGAREEAVLKALAGKPASRAQELEVGTLTARQVGGSLGILREQGLVYCERKKGTSYQVWWVK